MLKGKSKRLDKQVDFFTIDLPRLAAVEDLGLFLQLFAAQNDINSVAYFAGLIESRRQELSDSTGNKLARFHTGLDWYLFRLRVGTLAETLRSVVMRLKIAESEGTKHVEMWRIIKANPLVEEQYRIVEQYLPEHRKGKHGAILLPAGPLYSKLKGQLFMRDKLSSHHDMDAYLTVFDFAAEHSDRVGWLQDGEQGTLTRALFIDALVACSFYSAHGVDALSDNMSTDPAFLEAVKHIEAVLKSFTNFVHELSLAYFHEFNCVRHTKEIPDMRARI